MHKRFTTVADVEEYLYAVPRARTTLLRKEDLSLAPIRRVLSALGDPHKAYPIVYVWGTSGKGSTVSFLAGILKAAGLRVGHLYSPHVDDIRERMQINQKKIGKKDFVACAEDVVLAAEKMNKKGLKNDPSFFEIITAMELLAFARTHVDIAIVEVGLGGRMDATNVCPRILSILTSIDLDHRNVLGYTLAEIAVAESALIHRGVPLVTQERKKVPLAIIRAEARKRKAPVHVVGDETSVDVILQDLRGTICHIRTPYARYNNVRLQAVGYFQVINARTAIRAAEMLREQGFAIPASAIKNGLSTVRVPGRFDVIQHNPPIILDGAHNPAKARALRDTWKKLFQHVSPTVILAIKPKKDAAGIIRALMPLRPYWILTTAGEHDMIPPRDIARLIRKMDPQATVVLERDPRKAVMRAQRTKRPVLATGSLYLVSVLRHIFL